MDTTKNYYAALGVLPSAEDAVIRAVYRALARRYHPDKVDGSREEATRRMAEINEAYEVLSNKEARNAYDRARGTRAKPGDDYFGQAEVNQNAATEPEAREDFYHAAIDDGSVLAWPRLWARQIDFAFCCALAAGLAVLIGATHCWLQPTFLCSWRLVRC